MSGDFTIVARVDINSNGDEDEWVRSVTSALRTIETDSYRQVERFSVTIERPSRVWP